MQDAYVGDIGDYGKYALLRAVTDAGLSLAINWYFVQTRQNGKQDDGKYTDYLNQRDKFCPDNDPGLKELFDELHRIVKEDQTRKVDAIEKSGLLHLHTSPFREQVNADRERWHRRALAATEGAQVVFLDPDNGLAPENSYNEKHVRKNELTDYYQRGQTVILYQHRPQMQRRQACVERIRRFDREELRSDRLFILEFPRFTNRFYFIFTHQEHAAVMEEICTQLPPRLPEGFCRRVQ